MAAEARQRGYAKTRQIVRRRGAPIGRRATYELLLAAHTPPFHGSHAYME